jgi:hypothetical protein
MATCLGASAPHPPRMLLRGLDGLTRRLQHFLPNLTPGVTIDRLPVLFGYQYSLVLPDFSLCWVLTWSVATLLLFPSYWLAVAFNFALTSYY